MNNRILGIIGSALLILGIFLPIVSIMGLLNFSYFNMIQLAPGTFFTGILLLLLGIGSLLLALKHKYKLLIATGVVSLLLLAFDFFRIKSTLSDATSRGAETGGEFARQMSEAVSIGFGFYIMAIAAILLIVAGVMKSSVPVGAASWTPPPPPPPYTPGQ
jgi:multisubunit Na+/H+ antiporter MnhG subunit